ncbi:alpha/beta fold hydrolase [Escherichia coli]
MTYLVDLPGFGRSRGFGALSLADMAEAVLQQAPDKAIWLGWSLGGGCGKPNCFNPSRACSGAGHRGVVTLF